MKVRLAALLTFAIAFAFPSIAQQTNIPDPQLREQLVAFEKKYDEALNNNDAAAIAVFLTHN